MTLFLKASKGNNRISKSTAFHNVGAAYTKHLSNNKLAHVLLIGGTHNKQGSEDARVRIVVLLTLSRIKSHKYSGAVLFYTKADPGLHGGLKWSIRSIQEAVYERSI